MELRLAERRDVGLGLSTVIENVMGDEVGWERVVRDPFAEVC